MEKMQTTMLKAPCSVNVGCSEVEVVAKRLDQLEDLGRYSVIYEIARIETILGHPLHQPMAPHRPRPWY